MMGGGLCAYIGIRKASPLNSGKTWTCSVAHGSVDVEELRDADGILPGVEARVDEEDGVGDRDEGKLGTWERLPRRCISFETTFE